MSHERNAPLTILDAMTPIHKGIYQSHKKNVNMLLPMMDLQVGDGRNVRREQRLTDHHPRHLAPAHRSLAFRAPAVAVRWLMQRDAI